MPGSTLVLTMPGLLLTCPDSFRTLVLAFVGDDWSNPAIVSCSYDGLDLPELPVLPCPVVCLFWPGSAFADSAF